MYTTEEVHNKETQGQLSGYSNGWPRAFWVISFGAVCVFASGIHYRYGISPSLWYFATFATVTAMVNSFTGPARRRSVDVTSLSFLVGWGLLGTVAGRIFYGQEGNALPFFLAMVLVVLWWASGRVLPVNGVVALIRILSAVYSVFAILVVQFSVPLSSEGHFHHQTSFFLVAGAVLATVTLRWLELALVMAAIIVTYLNYPALSYLLGFAVAAICICAFYVNRAQMILVLAAAVAICSSIAMNIDLVLGSISHYFTSVGKTDNSETREALLEIGLRKFFDRPWFGSWFIEDIAIYAPGGITGKFKYVPVHNDYLQLAIGGGIVFAAAFVAIMVIFLIRGVVTLSSRSAPTEDRVILVTGMSAIASILVMCSVNPILIDIRTALFFSLSVVLSLNSMARIERACS
ncbi:hypothetical protein I1A62_37410 [Rhodococcus sp. USK10]|uniref:O-antigen ligase family protein n=1 Tax=Rhodococcus sp. USK10 TaxID=2789739 RepID=UPI001C5EA5B2|nr:hypothetical protein [Rhodococcus sp. USK10]QYB02805.1 hypothetical protein I1A62_37410 [Rhodococcus sp. USK10]